MKGREEKEKMYFFFAISLVEKKEIEIKTPLLWILFALIELSGLT